MRSVSEVRSFGGDDATGTAHAGSSASRMRRRSVALLHDVLANAPSALTPMSSPRARVSMELHLPSEDVTRAALRRAASLLEDDNGMCDDLSKLLEVRNAIIWSISHRARLIKDLV